MKYNTNVCMTQEVTMVRILQLACEVQYKKVMISKVQAQWTELDEYDLSALTRN